MGEKSESWLPVVTDQQRTQRNFLERGKYATSWTSPMVQGLRFGLPVQGDAGSVPSQRTKIPPAVWYGQKKFFLICCVFMSICICHSICQCAMLITHILCQNLCSCTLQTCAFLCMQILLHLRNI